MIPVAGATPPLAAPTRLSDQELTQRGTALGVWLKANEAAYLARPADKLTFSDGAPATSRMEGQVRRFPNGWSVKVDVIGGQAVATSNEQASFIRFHGPGGVPVLAMDLAQHALHGYSATLIDPETGSLLWTDEPLSYLTRPVAVPPAAQILGTLTADQALRVAKAANLAAIGQDHV
jgi:hypothetical protein